MSSSTYMMRPKLQALARALLIERQRALADDAIPARDDAHAEARRVSQALERIEAGTWGQCATCGKLIDEHRLRGMPEAVWCVHCADHPRA